MEAESSKLEQLLADRAGLDHLSVGSPLILRHTPTDEGVGA